MPPSAMFYDDSLEPCATANGLVSWSGLPNPKVPVMFIGSDSLDDCIDEVTFTNFAFPRFYICTHEI